jgi:hypothetical protein
LVEKVREGGTEMYTRIGMCVLKDGTRIFKVFRSGDVVAAQQAAIDWVCSIKRPGDEAIVIWPEELIEMLAEYADKIPTDVTDFDLRLLASMGIEGLA